MPDFLDGARPEKAAGTSSSSESEGVKPRSVVSVRSFAPRAPKRRRATGSDRRRRVASIALLTLAGASPALSAEPAAHEPVADSPSPKVSWVVSRSALSKGGPSMHGRERVDLEDQETLELSFDVFPDGAPAVGVELPETLGGGYLFHQRFQRVGGASTRLYRARTWTAPLEPWGTLPVAIERVVPGWDRLYVLARGRTFALLPGAERAVPPTPFPAVPTVTDLRFWGEDAAALRAPLVGWLMTEDRGRSFRAVSHLPELAQGALGPSPKRRGRTMYEGLVAAVRSATPTSEGTFVFFEGHKHRELILSGTQVKLKSQDRKDALGACSAEGELRGYWLCRRADEDPPRTHLARIEQGKLVAARSALGLRRTLAVDETAVLLEGGCEKADSAGACLLSEGGAEEVPPPKEPPLAWGVRGGQVVGLYRDLSEQEAKFRLVDLRSGATVSGHLPDAKQMRALGRGSVHQRLHFTNGFGFWLTSGENFVGVTITASGISYGPVQSQLRRTTFAGPRALIWGALGFGRETIDGGITWNDLLLPDSETADEPAEPSALTRVGASRVGAVLGDRVRIGWGAPALTVAPEELKEIPLPPLGGGRNQFSCEVPPGAPLREEEAPVRREPKDSGVLSFSMGGLDAQVELVGAAGPQFGRESRVSVRYHDPFTTSEMRSLATRGLFSSRTEAEEALGLFDASVSYATGYLSPTGKGGIIFLRSREATRLFAFGQGEPVYEIEHSGRLPTSGLIGVARRSGAHYLAYIQGGRLTLLRERGFAFEPFSAFPLEDIGNRYVGLAEGERENLAIVMDGDTGLFVYPLSERGELEGKPLFFEHQGKRAPTCEDQSGYTFVRDFSVSPLIEGPGGALPLLAVRARFRASSRGLCLDALSARARSSLKDSRAKARSNGGSSLPLSVFGSIGRPLGTLECR